MSRPLDRLSPCRDTGGSLKNVSSTPAPLLRSRVFCAPNSGGRRTCAGRYPAMGVSGIRKDPDALTCVESTPTLFRVALSLGNVRRHHA